MKNELANPDFAKVSNDELAFKLGMVNNPVAEMTKLQQTWETNSHLQKDIESIKAELKNQLQAYLDQQPASAQ
ncbi:hypothetical protein D3C80_2005860 [compost metagenome]